MVRVGFVGLGRMGRPMCRHLLKVGHALTVFDINPSAVEALVEVGAAPAASPAEVGAASEVILVMVPTDDDVTGVVSGVLTEAQPGTVIAICSSTLPETCLRAAEAAAPKGLVDSQSERDG